MGSEMCIRDRSYARWKTDARLTQVEPAVATKRSSPDGAAVTSLGEVAVRLKVMFKIFKMFKKRSRSVKSCGATRTAASCTLLQFAAK